MSKIIKADQWVEAHPCRLEPIDVDAFFINDELLKNEPPAAEPAAAETTFAMAGEAEAGGLKADITGVPPNDKVLPAPEIDLNHLADFAEQLGALIGGRREQASTAGMDEPLGAPVRKAPKADSFIRAGNQAEELTQTAKRQAADLAQNAKKQAESLLEGAQTKFNELTENAQKQARVITFGADRQAEQIANEARQQAEFALESANRKATELLKKAQLEAEAATQTAGQQAAELTEAAKRQAAELLENAKQQALEIKNDARREGLEAGRAEGLTAVRNEYEEKLAGTLALIAQAEAERLNRIRSSEPELLKLAVAIAEKIIGAALNNGPETQLTIVKQALAEIPATGSMIIKLNPRDCRFIEENLPALQESLRDPVPVKIQEEQGISMGSCYIETEHGNIDARIKTQLEVIMAEILKVGRLE